MRFRLLGPIEAHDNGREVVLRGRMQQALLAILLLHRNESVSRDQLVETLWAGEPPPNAQKALQVHVWRLRQALGRENGDSSQIVTTQGGGYAMRLAPGQLDLDRFEGLLAEGRKALSAGDSAEAARLLCDALDLWRGPPLGELAYEPFAQTEIARLEELHMTALEARIEAELALGWHSELIGELEGLVEQHPYREHPREQLMLALYRSGRQADALEAYGHARRTLVDELGIEPGRRLQTLQHAILAQDPALDGPPEAAGREGPPPPRRPGRPRRLIAAAGAVAALAIAGVGAILVLGGEPEPDPLPSASAGNVDAAGCLPVAYGGPGRPEALIAASTALRGPASEQGVQISQALKLVLAQHDWRAGDYTVGLQICNEKTTRGAVSLARCRRNARSFAASRRVLAVAGPWSSACALEMLPILNRAPGGPLPAISGSATYVGLTRSGPGVPRDEPERLYPTGRRAFARVIPTDDAQGAAGALFAQRAGARKAFVLHDGESYGIGVAEAFRVAAERGGLSVIGAGRWDPEADGYRDLAARIGRSDPDVVYLGGSVSGNGGELINEIREALRPGAQIIGPDGFGLPSLIVEQAGPDAEGFTWTTGALPDEALPPAGTEFVTEFEDQFLSRPCCFSVHTAQAALMILNAIAASDGSREQVLENLLETPVEDGLLGDFELDRYGDITLKTIGVYRIQEGRPRFDTAITPVPEALAGE